MSDKNKVNLTEDIQFQEILKENERRANKFAARVFYVSFIISILDVILVKLKVFKLNVELYYFIFMIIPLVAYKSNKVSQKVLKWINIICITAFASICYYSLNYNAVIVNIVPFMLAALYFSYRTTIITFIFNMSVTALTTYFIGINGPVIDCNRANVVDGTIIEVSGTLRETLFNLGYRNARYLSNLMRVTYLPNLLQAIIIFSIALAITKFGHNMLIKYAKGVRESTKINTELKLAGELQANALPSVNDINGKYNFEIATTLNPAKEAGGDFYDFAMIDDNHLAIIIADVCGKAIPAAMFMMAAKEKLHESFDSNKSPSQMLYEVNNALCQNNPRKMFATIWLGIVDIKTGLMISANAGHEDPIIKKANGEFKLIQESHGVSAGVFKNKQYPDQQYQFEPGDILVQYTDGITEARNIENQMYGQQAIIDNLNKAFANTNPSSKEVNESIKSDVTNFMGNAAQADDITTLIFKYL